MGANFAPCVAKLFMSKLEEETIFQNRTIELVLYRRFIGDLIVIWKGDEESLIIFFQKLSDNQKNII